MGNCCISGGGKKKGKKIKSNIVGKNNAEGISVLKECLEQSIEERYELGKVLGQGEFGITYFCTDKETRELLACKSISKSKLRTAVDFEDVRREVAIMKHLSKHSNIVSLKSTCEDEQAVHLVMELCEGGELFDRIVARGHYTERAAALLTRTIVEVVQLCHQHGVIHRDLKPENFLFANKKENAPLKAIDFGLSVFFKPGDRFSELVGSPFYMAPEVLKRNYGPEVDVWSAGVILYILLCGAPPFYDESETGVANAIIRGDPDFKRDPWPQVSENVKNLVRQMLEPDPNLRLTAQQVLEHPWLQNAKKASNVPLGDIVKTRLRQFSMMNKFKKRALRVMAEHLSIEETKGIKDMFGTMDTDSSGTISYEKMKAGLHKLGYQMADSEVQTLIDAADADGSGTLDYGEFVAASIHMQGMENDDCLHKAFLYFDNDGSGYIEIEEFREALANDFGSNDTNVVNDIFYEVDADKDGRSRTLVHFQKLAKDPTIIPCTYPFSKILFLQGTRENSVSQSSIMDVRFIDQGHHVILDNGIVQVTISKPGGIITGLRYGGLDNLLEVLNKETNRGYWDLNWNEPGGKDTFDVPSATSFNVVEANKDKVEVAFIRPYNPSSSWKMVPLNIEKRFALLRGSSGFYTYAIYERPSGWPDFNLNQTRVTFKLRKDRFQYMAIADNRQRVMPLPDDRMPDKCKILAYPEAVLLTRPANSLLQGEVDDKYQYSCDNKENRVHGWISFDPMVGFWVITPSDEFRNGGPLKQNLTSHVGPTSLAMFHSAHYAGEELCPKFCSGEAWQKVFGPVFIYLNYASRGTHPFSLWQDAKSQMIKEVQSWPYEWPESPLFHKRLQRGCITGQILVQDRYVVEEIQAAHYAFLGLSAPGGKGSWQIESKGYQFWSQADVNGYFTIENVCPGTYNLYGWVPGVLGDYMKEGSITIYPGCRIDAGLLIYEPPRDGPTIWEIGVPDRTAAEFFIPDPKPCNINKLFLNHPERFRQYGLWERYSEIYDNNDLIYTVGASDWRRDWYFAHTCRIKSDGSLHPSTWQVKFQVKGWKQNSLYKLRLAIASSTIAAIQVRFNDANIYKPHFDTMQFGKDNAIARHGIHGLYHLFNIDVSGNLLVEGENTLYLTQRKPTSPFSGVMYDYLRLEEVS